MEINVTTFEGRKSLGITGRLIYFDPCLYIQSVTTNHVKTMAPVYKKTEHSSVHAPLDIMALIVRKVCRTKCFTNC